MFIFASVLLQIKLLMADERAKIFDPLRKKRVVLTPEEQVRQYFIQWLHNVKGYPLTLMMSEHTISYNRRTFRCDIVCFDRKLTPLMVVECKAPGVKIDNSVIEQVTRYNMALNVRFVAVTNGIATFALALDAKEQKYLYIDDIPEFAKTQE